MGSAKLSRTGLALIVLFRERLWSPESLLVFAGITAVLPGFTVVGLSIGSGALDSFGFCTFLTGGSDEDMADESVAGRC